MIDWQHCFKLRVRKNTLRVERVVEQSCLSHGGQEVERKREEKLGSKYIFKGTLQWPLFLPLPKGCPPPNSTTRWGWKLQHVCLWDTFKIQTITPISPGLITITSIHFMKAVRENRPRGSPWSLEPVNMLGYMIEEFPRGLIQEP